MDYFILSQNENVVNPVSIIGLDSKQYPYQMPKEAFTALADLNIAYFHYNKGVEMSDILEQPTFLVSDKIKRLMSLYDTKILFKGLQLFSLEEEGKTAPLYWIPYIELIQCLHSKTKKYGTGMVEKIVLDSKAIQGKDIFRIGGILENKIVISLAVAESLLRRSLYGIGLEKVEVI